MDPVLTPEEIAILKELAESMMIMGKVRRSIAAFLLWASSITIAAVALWTWWQGRHG